MHRLHLLAAIGGMFACAITAPVSAAADSTCVPVATWASTESGRPVLRSVPQLMRELSTRSAVLLGETHASAEHHRWQLHTMAALHGLQPNMVLGFEMFPRRVQSALDQWVAGELTEAEFLERSDWNTVWGFDAALYMPIFDFARMHRIPMVALNVERSLVAEVGKSGWASIPVERREGVGDPAAPAQAYREALYTSYVDHLPEDSPLRKQATRNLEDPEFRHFVEAMQVWDRAMAQAIAQAHARPGSPLVVAIMGSGHLREGYGVGYQLRDVGIRDAATLLPWDAGDDCAALTSTLADAVFGVNPPAAAATPRPRLGVMLDKSDAGVSVRQVVDASVAAKAGLRSGDIITEIAGLPVTAVEDVVAAVQRQAPGTWLPMQVRRGKDTLELVARFPAQP